jgi:hypothetical protein
MIRTTKKEMDKMLTRLMAWQRECFKQGSQKSLTIWPRFNDESFSIHVTAHNELKPVTNSEGEEYTFICLTLYGFWDKDENEAEMQRINDYLDLESNGQR